MREIRLYGSEGGGTETNRSFLPLSIAQGETLGNDGPRPMSPPGFRPNGAREPQWLGTKFTSRRNGEAMKGG
jgi:hypothetical protein